MTRLLLVCVGGALGTGARYLLTTAIVRCTGGGFPWGTLTVNVAGSFLLAALLEAALTHGAIPPAVQVVLATGVMGGFTTYSSFNQEALNLLTQGAPRVGLAYIAATLMGCMVAGLAGSMAARWALS